MQLLSILAVASLFGGMMLFSIGFGTLAFKLLDKTTARKLIRDTFPYFYLFILFNSALAAVFCYYVDARACVLMGLICATTIPNRQILMPAINQASDNSDKKNLGQTSWAFYFGNSYTHWHCRNRAKLFILASDCERQSQIRLIL